MRITIKRWGNSAGMITPNIAMKELNLQPGQNVEAQVSSNQLILTSISRRYSLNELLAQYDMNAAELSEQDAWSKSTPAGDETWQRKVNLNGEILYWLAPIQQAAMNSKVLVDLRLCSPFKLLINWE